MTNPYREPGEVVPSPKPKWVRDLEERLEIQNRAVQKKPRLVEAHRGDLDRRRSFSMPRSDFASVHQMNGFDEMTQTYNGIPIENLLDPHPVRKAAPVTDHSDYPTKHIMQFFEYDHLPPNLARVSQPFCELAKLLTDPDGIVGYDLTLPCNPERTVALRKLLEAKDAAVRALQSFVAETMRLEREKKEALVSTEDAIDLVDRAKKLSPAALDRWLIMINKERIHGMTKIRFDIVKKQLEEIEKSQ